VTAVVERKDEKMTLRDALKTRRTFYHLKKEMPVSEQEVLDLIQETTALVPDAFNMRSQRVVVALGAKQDELWDRIDKAFGGKVPREKIDGFRAAAGTILYFIDEDVVRAMQEKVPRYAENFPLWANHANGMLQISLWAGLTELGLGANIQHYNPVIDDTVKELFGLPGSYKLVAQMPFGGRAAEADPKDGEDIRRRVQIER
jgi:uncharacterized protein